MKKLTLLFIILFTIAPIWAQVNLTPAPAKVSPGRGTFSLNSSTNFETNTSYARQIANALTAELKPLNLTTSSSGKIVMNLNPEANIKPEGYILQVTPEKILLEASTESGLFYAKEALLQLARADKGKIPVCRIEDSPRYSWRGLMFDESRHFFGKEKVKTYLDIMASLRMNVFHWHLTDEPGWRIEIKKYPKLTTIGATGNYHNPDAPAAFYTQEDIKEIVAYAAERTIT